MSSLAKGIFWIKDINNVENSIIHLGIFVDTCGNIDPEIYDTKHDKEFNYKKIWNSLNKEITEGKSYDYFPRGRVTVASNKAIVYVSSHLFNYKTFNIVCDIFDLRKENEMYDVRMRTDSSLLCHLDRKFYL